VTPFTLSVNQDKIARKPPGFSTRRYVHIWGGIDDLAILRKGIGKQKLQWSAEVLCQKNQFWQKCSPPRSWVVLCPGKITRGLHEGFLLTSHLICTEQVMAEKIYICCGVDRDRRLLSAKVESHFVSSSFHQFEHSERHSKTIRGCKLLQNQMNQCVRLLQTNVSILKFGLRSCRRFSVCQDWNRRSCFNRNQYWCE